MFGGELAAGWWQVDGWLTAGGGWRELASVQGGRRTFQSLRSSSIGPYCRSKQSFQASIQGGRLAAGARGRQQEGNSAVTLSMKRQKQLPILKTPGHRAQKPRFCAQNARKRGFRSQKSTKTTILCSKRPKMGVPEAKKAQKPRFCARNTRKRGFQRAKAHKNADFVLEMPENEGSEAQKSTKTSILCSKSPKTGVPEAKSAQKSRFCARNARKWGFRKPKKHKNPDFVLGKKGSGSGKRKYWHRKRNRSLPANHRARFQNANTS